MNFLYGGGRYLSNSASMSISYALSRRFSIAVTPNYTFSEAGVGVNLSRGSSYGGSVRWNYRTSERQTVGVQYNSQLLHTAGVGNFQAKTNAPHRDPFFSPPPPGGARQHMG